MLSISIPSLGRRESKRERQSLSTQASSLPPPRNSGVESAEHRDENRFSLRHRRVSKQGGRICVGHSRLIAAKLARSSTIRWNFRNFLLDHRSAFVALRPNHGLECCWKWAGWFSTIIEFFKRSDLSLRVKFFVFSTFCKSWSEDVVLRLWRGMGKGNRLLIEVDGNILISRSEFLEFFGNFSLSKLIAQSGLSFLFIVKFYYSGILLGSLLKCILEGEEGG